MTVEVLLMNRAAVALAADSAVTITRPDRGYITQTNVPKCFVLNDKFGTGMMVFGLGEFSGCPWPTLVHDFRGRGGGREPALADTVQAFLGFLGTLTEGEQIEKQAGAQTFNLFAAQTVGQLKWRHEELLATTRGKRPAEIVAEALAQLEHEVEYDDDWEEGAWVERPRPRIGAPTPAVRQILDANLDEIVARAVEHYFGPGSIDRDGRARIAAIIEKALYTDWMPGAADYAGVVMAGFGENEVSPAYYELQIYGLIGDLVKYRYGGAGRATSEQPVWVDAFAQAGAVERFIHGAESRFLMEAIQRIRFSGAFFTDQALAAWPGDAKAKAELSEMIANIVGMAAYTGQLSTRQAWREMVQDSFGEKVRVATGPEALGELAGKLISLALLEADMTSNPTVARPASVLCLSKGHAEIIKPGKVVV